MSTVDAWGWIDAPVSEVAAVAQRAEHLPEWLELVRASEPGDLRVLGASVDATLCGRGGGSATLTTVRVVRDVVRLEVTSDGQRLAGLCISVSAWDGGTAVELAADLDGWSPGDAWTRWRLRRSIARLAELTARPAAQTVVGATSSRGWRPELVRPADVRSASRP